MGNKQPPRDTPSMARRPTKTPCITFDEVLRNLIDSMLQTQMVARITGATPETPQAHLDAVCNLLRVVALEYAEGILHAAGLEAPAPTVLPGCDDRRCFRPDHAHPEHASLAAWGAANRELEKPITIAPRPHVRAVPRHIPNKGRKS